MLPGCHPRVNCPAVLADVTSLARHTKALDKEVSGWLSTLAWLLSSPMLAPLCVLPA